MAENTGFKSGQLKESMKSSAIELLERILGAKRSFFTSNKDIINQIFLEVLRTEIPSNLHENLTKKTEDEEKEGEETLVPYSERLLDFVGNLAQGLPKKIVFPLFQKLSDTLLSTGSSEDICGLMLIYAYSCESMVSEHRKNLNSILQGPISTGVNHNDLKAKRFTYFLLIYLIEYLTPEMRKFSQQVNEFLISGSQVQDEATLQSVVSAISSFIYQIFDQPLDDEEEAEKKMVLNLFNILTNIMKNTQDNSKNDELIRTCVEGFGSFFEYHFTLLKPYLMDTLSLLKEKKPKMEDSERYKTIIPEYLNCFSSISKNFMNDEDMDYQQHFGDFEKDIINEIQTDNEDGKGIEKESLSICFKFLSLGTRRMKEDFVNRTLEFGFPIAIAKIRKLIESKKKDMRLENDENELNEVLLRETPLGETVSQILGWFGEIAEHTPEIYLQIKDKIKEEKIEFTREFENGIFYQEAVGILYLESRLVIHEIKMGNNGVIPPFEKGWKNQIYAEDIQKGYRENYLSLLNVALGNQITFEADQVIDDFIDLIQKAGPALIMNEQDLMKEIITKAFAFLDREFDEDDDEGVADNLDDSDDEKSVVDDSTVDVFNSLITLFTNLIDLLKIDGKPLFELMIIKFLENWKKLNDDMKCDFLGEYSDAIVQDPSLVDVSPKDIMDKVFALKRPNDTEVIRNACYTTGMMHLLRPSTMEQFVESSMWFYLEVFQKFSFPQEKDNAIGAIIRIYLVDEKKKVPQLKVNKV